MPNNKYKILLVEDDKKINQIVATLLETKGYQVIGATTCVGAKLLYESHHPDLIILDLGLPDKDGLSLLSMIRKNDLTPVIVLSARTEESDKVNALDMGANDYITKPFGTEELLARVRSVLRVMTHRNEEGKLPKETFELEDLLIDYNTRQVFIDGKEIKLTQTEYNIIALLSEKSGKVLTYHTIIKEVWGYNDIHSKKKLQVNMANIRKKFGEKPGEYKYILNELGVGYRMYTSYKT